MIEENAVDVMIAIGPKFFYTVSHPVTLWFLDRGKRGTSREDTVLFLDARNTYRPIDRAHRDFMPEQIELLANAVRLYRGEEPESLAGSEKLMAALFPDRVYADVPGLCKVATIAEVEKQGWSLNPGRYVGAATDDEDDGDFAIRLAELHEEFTVLSDEAEMLRRTIDSVTQEILEA